MSSVLHPVGPERRATYWRRRLVAVLVLLLLVAGLALGVRALLPQASPEQVAAQLDPQRVSPTLGPVASTATGTPTTGTSTASPSPSTAEAVEPCAGGALELALTSDAAAYGPGVTPKFTLSVKNVGQSPCTAEIGSAVRAFVVEDAAGARVWSSADCQSSTSAQSYELAPGKWRTMSTSWSRQRSAAGCPDDQPAAEAGTYTVQGTWQDTPAAPLTVTLAG
ncbi:BsuPI-related putative proteinase inhibitor [Kineococcus indalonis]|uniref:BsuPI-related putative proteinase inhibitor n=1 Tax=Kineococcus indalonis TaxID=2696566 RepID=UPI001412D18F|nr:BsuPI-related putative proteinase inhibitor [Kineococcus indalonis]NAZ85754.1 hypothetical protein [Kineococcus indalonis]